MNEQTYKTIVTKCWGDPDFKHRLIVDPVATLRTEAFSVPDGIKVTVVENTASEFTFVIPPESVELSDDALDDVSGGIIPDLKESRSPWAPIGHFPQEFRGAL